MKTLDSLQKFISFGYLYLILMGILQESVFYNQLGINILHFSTIADILISPIATLTSKPIVLILAIVLFIIFFVIQLYLSKNTHKNWVQKVFLKNKENLSVEEVKKHIANQFVLLYAIGLLSFFLGLGIGSGYKIAEMAKNNKLKHMSKMSFSSSETEDIYLIGTNSLYYFYYSKGNQNVKIAPIGTIKSLELNGHKMAN